MPLIRAIIAVAVSVQLERAVQSFALVTQLDAVADDATELRGLRSRRYRGFCGGFTPAMRPAATSSR